MKITINAITNNEKKYLKGYIGKESYTVENSPEAQKFLTDAQHDITLCDTAEEAISITDETLAAIEKLRISEDAKLESVLGEDLYLDPKTGEYHIRFEDRLSEAPIHKFFVNKMIEANDRGLNPKPWLIFWVRLMRNELFRGNETKIERLVEYMGAQHLDEDKKASLMEEGYAEDVATFRATFDQLSITEEGILVTFKYVSLRNKKFVVEKDEKTGEQTIVEADRYTRKLVINEDTGEVISDELDLPKYAEELKFVPPVMGDSGDAFTCRELDDVSVDPVTGHNVQIGKVHELLDGFKAVNCNDNVYGSKGLHVGSHQYVQGFGGITDYLIDCLVAPEDVGAVADLRESSEGAIRCKRYMAVGAVFQVSKGMYHPSNYAKMLDIEWDEAKAALTEVATKQLEDIDKLQ